MATVSIPAPNPVPEGRANTGEAFILGDTNTPLKILMRLDEVSRKQKQVVAAEKAAKKAKEETATFNDFKALPQLSTEGWLYQDDIDRSASNTYDELKQAWQNKGLSRLDRLSLAQRLEARHNTLVERAKTAKQLHTQFMAERKGDPTFNQGELEKAAFQNIYDTDAGHKRDLLTYDPTTLLQLDERDDLRDVGAAAKQFVGNLWKESQVTAGRDAKPGGTGWRNSTASNLFRLDSATGQVVVDTQTGLPELNTEDPSILLKANAHPATNAILNGLQRRQEQALAETSRKIETGEPVSDEELAAINAPKSRLDFLNDYVRTNAYARTTQQITNKPAPRAPKGPKQQTTGGAVSGYGETAVRTDYGEQLLPTPLAQPAPKVPKTDGTLSDVVARSASFPNMHLQVPGGKLQQLGRNMQNQDMILGGARAVLVDKDGRIFTPQSLKLDGLPDAEKQRQTEEWMVGALRRPNAKERGYRVAFAVDAVPVRGQNTLGSVQEIAASLQVANTRAKHPKAAAAIWADAQRIHAQQNATYLIPLEGENQRRLYGYSPIYREQAAERQAFLDRLAARVRQPQLQPAGAPAAGKFYRRPATAQPARPLSVPNLPAPSGAGKFYTRPTR